MGDYRGLSAVESHSAMEDSVADSHAPLALAALPVGTCGTVTGLSGGPGFAGRLAGMGLTVGAEVQVLQNPGRGPVLVRVRETRLALGRGEATRVLVRPSDTEDLLEGA